MARSEGAGTNVDVAYRCSHVPLRLAIDGGVRRRSPRRYSKVQCSAPAVRVRALPAQDRTRSMRSFWARHSESDTPV